jgi:regulator of RNase E activity RraB
MATIGADPSAAAPPPAVPVHHGLNLWTVLVAVAGALVIVRLYTKLRAAAKTSRKDWDEQEIDRLRKQGYVPFKEYPVDFFLALPDMEACEGVRRELEPQGYAVDVKPITNDSTLCFSLHALRSMRLVVPEMEEKTRRLSQLAEQFNGRYDGWSASPDATGVIMRGRRKS